MKSMVVMVEGNESMEQSIPVEITLRRMQPPIKGNITKYNRDRQ